ncbi:glycosyltransferase [Sporosarcina ureae]|uniref:glycosyltransferase n=1 Tax=Sporosarcina ureae TaxID=1571 RepID=UPI0026EE4D3D|nr:glycosyltransferase [Sporosarcina ureae]
MKVTFYSNFLSHHQLPFCNEMYEKLGKDFKFVATEPIHEERLELGYEDMSEKYPFSLNAYTNEESYDKALQLGEDSEIVIIGSAPAIFTNKRLKQNKITFRYSERIFKRGRYRIISPRSFIPLVRDHTRYMNKNVYMLCASAYTAADFKLVRAYKKKAFKWGYFPEVKQHDLKILMEKKKNIVPKILWVGRLLELKHPEQAVKIAAMLKASDYSFHMDIIGSGEMENELKEMIKKYELTSHIEVLGNMKPEQVRIHMEKANIYLFTSDFNEGWGAVLNEAMNSGCAVVASHAIGSVPFLLEQNKNGLIYKNGDLNHLYKCVTSLLDNSYFAEKLGTEAYNTLYETWNARFATTRLIALFESLLDGVQLEYEQGPCSQSEIISHKYIY